MAKKKKATTKRKRAAGEPKKGSGGYDSYSHEAEATLRPEVGLQDQFMQVQKPKKYRYDSSLAPELVWDENAEREFAEWLLNLVAEAGEKGEEVVFAEPQRWQRKLPRLGHIQ